MLYKHDAGVRGLDRESRVSTRDPNSYETASAASPYSHSHLMRDTPRDNDVRMPFQECVTIIH